MQNGLRRYSFNERSTHGPASRRVQSKQLPSAPPRERPRNSAGLINSSLGENHEQHAAVTKSRRERTRRRSAHGADEIAEFIFGKRGSRRKVYYLAECTRLPVFRLGSMLCARRSVITGWIEFRQKNQVREASWLAQAAARSKIAASLNAL